MDVFPIVKYLYIPEDIHLCSLPRLVFSSGINASSTLKIKERNSQHTENKRDAQYNMDQKAQNDMNRAFHSRVKCANSRNWSVFRKFS